MCIRDSRLPHLFGHEHVEALGDALEADEDEEGEGDDEEDTRHLVLRLSRLAGRLLRLLLAHLAVHSTDLYTQRDTHINTPTA